MKNFLLVLLGALALASCASTSTAAPSTAPAAVAPAAEQTTVTEYRFPGVFAKKTGATYQVTWVFEEPDAEKVLLVGDFVAWDPTKGKPLAKNEYGLWVITLPAKKNSEFIYKYYVDGMWFQDPAAVATVSDGYGGRNGRVVVEDLVEGQ